ncbi:MAG: hypothetical protein RIF41_32705 [Polyangiaceae bacterium]
MKLSKKLVMVKLDEEQRPAALTKFEDHGGYVPRVLFLDEVCELLDVTSGDPRFPYFYSHTKVGELQAGMRRALSLQPEAR